MEDNSNLDGHSTCAICREDITKEDIVKHYKSVHCLTLEDVNLEGDEIPKKEDKTLFYCETCSKSFKYKKSLLRHEKHQHSKESKDKFTCGECFKDFSFKCNLLIHIKKMHSSNSKAINVDVNCALCGEKGTKKRINEHYTLSHDVEIEKNVLNFKTELDFLHWKSDIEKKEMCLFVKERSLYKNKDGTAKMSFKCFRTGKYKSRGKNLRNVKYMGSNKMEGHCPARIDYACFQGIITVNFIKTHIGHFQELARLPLPKTERKALANKIAQNIPFDNIIDCVRESVSTESDIERIHLLTKKDLFNIAQQYKIKIEKKKKKEPIEIAQELIPVNPNDFQELIIYETVSEEQTVYREIQEENPVQTLDERKNILLQKFTELVNNAQTHEELNILEAVYSSATMPITSETLTYE